MAKSRAKRSEPQTETESPGGAEADFNPGEFDPSMRSPAGPFSGDVGETDHPDTDASDGLSIQDAPVNGHAAALAGNQRAKAPDPFGIESISGGGNCVRLSKSAADGAWVIRFDSAPNGMTDEEGVPYGRERPHPVLEYLKSEGYRWGFANADGKGGWGKLMREGRYSHAEHLEVRQTLARAAEMIGANREQNRIPD
ncbi:hypothetical protein [Zavarzinella formosa]|uniref:hypothetical protein n=1 Tax=Zavarzinella formosa TaxID=360055 RepID=UPI0003084622|nr:hypothetical protein [Zavarzinella formosa]